MAEHSKIEWTDATWNPVTGCTLVSEGCANCYAARMQHHPSRKGLARLSAAGVAKFTGEVRFNEQWLEEPLRWKRPRMVFVCAHGDLFHKDVPDAFIDRVFAVMALSPQHTFQVLTKRSERMRDYLTKPLQGPWAGRSTRDGQPSTDVDWRVRAVVTDSLPTIPGKLLNAICERLDEHWPGDGFFRRWPLPNVWLGVSVEDQATADARIPELLATPAAIRFVSYEPALGPVDFRPWLHDSDCPAVMDDVCICSEPREAAVDWIIAGGESGANARPAHPDWFRAVRDQCAAAGTAFLFKQWGEWAPPRAEDLPGRPVMVRVGDVCIKPDGSHAAVRPDLSLPGDFEGAGAPMRRTGKTRTGRLLDGVEHNGFPALNRDEPRQNPA